jgi:hypothetical protein
MGQHEPSVDTVMDASRPLRRASSDHDAQPKEIVREVCERCMVEVTGVPRPSPAPRGRFHFKTGSDRFVDPGFADKR